MSNSIGDLKNSGLQGNNWPWQYKVLKGLQGIIDTLTAGVCCPPAQRTSRVVSVSNVPGAVPNGSYGFSIANVGSAAGTVDGQSLPAGVTINFDPGVNNTILGLPYDATGTDFLITYIL
jgi:hypothetical protein